MGPSMDSPANKKILTDDEFYSSATNLTTGTING